MPPPNWLDEHNDTVPVPKAVGEDVFWSTPPRYSVMNLASLPPEPLRPVPPPRHTWSARLLFGMISCAVLTLVALEMKAFCGGAPATFAHTASTDTSVSRH